MQNFKQEHKQKGGIVFGGCGKLTRKKTQMDFYNWKVLKGLMMYLNRIKKDGSRG